MSLSQIHEIDVGKYYCDYQAYNRTYHATHHLLDDEHANDENDKTRYVISEVTHKSLTKPSQREGCFIVPPLMWGNMFIISPLDLKNVSTPP